MELNTQYSWEIKLEGTPEEAEAWLAAAKADGWLTHTESRHKDDNRYYGGDGPASYSCSLLRPIDASLLPPKIRERLYPVKANPRPVIEDGIHYCGRYPIDGPFVCLNVQTHRANAMARTGGNTFGKVSAWIPVYGGGTMAAALCCHDIRLPRVYSWQAILDLIASDDTWTAEKKIADERREAERLHRRDSYSEIARAAKAKADPRQAPEEFLPYVTACCHYWQAAVGIEAINQIGYYRSSFKTIAGREFEEAKDCISLEDVRALPEPLPLTEAELVEANKPPLYECFECGFQTENPRLIDSGGMGCVRCNH